MLFTSHYRSKKGMSNSMAALFFLFMQVRGLNRGRLLRGHWNVFSFPNFQLVNDKFFIFFLIFWRIWKVWCGTSNWVDGTLNFNKDKTKLYLFLPQTKTFPTHVEIIITWCFRKPYYIKWSFFQNHVSTSHKDWFGVDPAWNYMEALVPPQQFPIDFQIF